MTLIPPPNFGYVEPDLYRSAIPGEMNFAFLQTLKLKTVLYLSTDAPSQLLLDFLREEDVELISMECLDGGGAMQRILEHIALDSMRIVLDYTKYPVLIMCNLGRHRTGTVVGCLRRLQGWAISSILDEFRGFTRSIPSPMHEQFIELFDTELVEIPDDSSKLPFHLPQKKHCFQQDTTQFTAKQKQRPCISWN